MSIERPVAGSGIASEPGMPLSDPFVSTSHDATRAGQTAGPVPPSMRLQILSTEHWSLLASRSLAWNESFSRAGMFLTTLSGAIVALALLGQASDFGQGFLLTALVLLPVVLFVGITTVVRMGDANYHDAICIVGMNRIRHAYLELAPDLEPYFVMSSHDDMRGVGITMGMPPGRPTRLHLLAATPAVISVVSSVVAAVIVGILAIELNAVTAIVLAVGIVAFVVSMVLFTRFGAENVRKGQASLHTIFPTPAGDGPRPPG